MKIDSIIVHYAYELANNVENAYKEDSNKVKEFFHTKRGILEKIQNSFMNDHYDCDSAEEAMMQSVEKYKEEL